MEKFFDLEKNAKQMPYSTPEGFFDQLERDVMEAVKTETKPQPKDRRTKILKMGLRVLGVAAAATALFVVVEKNWPKEELVTYDTGQVELAFNDLSTEDQEFLLEAYQDDIFMDNDSY